jgi:hypothetical protein
MRGMLRGAALAATAWAMLPGAANAQLISATNPESVAKVLRDKGYRAELTKDSEGDPLIKSGAEGVNFLLLFFNCTDGKSCATVQFYAGFDRQGSFSLEKLNEWNRTKRFGRAYRDNEGDPVIEMDVDMDDGGMSKALFEDNVEFWTSLLSSFQKFIDS